MQVVIMFGQAAVEETGTALTAGGATIMALSIGVVLSLLSFCLYKVMTLPPVENEEDEYHPPRSLSM